MKQRQDFDSMHMAQFYTIIFACHPELISSSSALSYRAELLLIFFKALHGMLVLSHMELTFKLILSSCRILLEEKKIRQYR